MGYAYELSICKFDLKLYKLVDVNFMTVSHLLIIFLETIQNLFSFCSLLIYTLIKLFVAVSEENYRCTWSCK